MTSLISDNQRLLNIFSKWISWSDLIVRADKCHVFGIQKTSTKSIQFDPYLVVSNHQIAPIKTEESFIYLGKTFNFDINLQESKSDLLSCIE